MTYTLSLHYPFGFWYRISSSRSYPLGYGRLVYWLRICW